MRQRKQTLNNRSNKSQRQNPKTNGSDPIFGVILVQIILCVILVASLVVVKKLDKDTFNSTKQRITELADINIETSLVTKTIDNVKFNYNYAGNLFTDFINPNKDKSDGKGGSNPVSIKDKLGMHEQLKPPVNASFAPIMTSAKLLAPISGTITSGFGYRYHPITKKIDFHTGIDVAAQEGTNILSALPGKVIEIGQSNIYGNYIVIEHSKGFKTVYSHCSKIIASVGMQLKRGERIATVGSTGISTGPHLHFEIKINDTFVDPTWVLL